MTPVARSTARTGMSRPFSRANALLEAQGAPGVDWSLEPLPQ